MGETVILETARLLLREFTLDDVAPLEAVLGDPVAMQWYPAPYDHKGVERWIARNIERYVRDRCGLWAMVLRSSGEVVGDCGCVFQEVEGDKEIEIAYHVRRDLWGNGYATEAARACMDYAFSKLGASRVISMIRPENLNSRRVAEKNGFKCDKIIYWMPKGSSGTAYEHCVYVKKRT